MWKYSLGVVVELQNAVASHDKLLVKTMINKNMVGF